ncbi:Ku protein [Cohnella candidum]|uniref:Ku domain-containing protein n=1 Tax=Cohnella candidum TaxID=2674991 RepID=A0A3G3K5K9_9BACL|nr:Ku protein [Cohnella candidum]AYQ75069.1 hypothetical protein EAV92_22445 [Cohnella candidum]
MQAFWKGTIQIAQLQVPIKLYSATEEKGISFRQQHADCGNPISHLKYCQSCQTEVENENIRKVYDLGGGKFVEVSEEELQAIAPPADKTFRVQHFVRSSELEPHYWKKHYFVGVDEVGGQAFELLRYSLLKMKRTGIGYVTMRSVQQLAALWASKDGLMLTTLHYADEVRAYPAANSSAVPEMTTELMQAFGSLVSGLSVPYDPALYPNVHNESMIHLIDSKIAGQVPEVSHPLASTDSSRHLTDFMSAIQRSLADIGQEEPDLSAKKAKRSKAAK